MAKVQTILIVDDDEKIRKLLRNVLEGDGFAVCEAYDGASVAEFLKCHAPPDLITLDITLGKESGLDIAKETRAKSQVPIIMVSGKDDVIDRVVGLEIGADDYITKPFHVREVIARIRAVLRRKEQIAATQRSTPSELNSEAFLFDGLIVVPDKHQIIDRNGLECDLTTGDFTLLNVFLARPKRVLSRDQLMDLTGGIEWSPLDRTIDNQVARLRKKIERNPTEPKLIKTVRGVGYVFAANVERTSYDG